MFSFSERDRRRRVYSQNFLRDDRVARRFLDLVDVDPDLLCLEIGAGEGALTERLATMCDRLVAYEIDEAVADRLVERVGHRDNTEIVVADFTWSSSPVEPFQVVGNVPFSITSPIMDWCLEAPWLTSATMITQLEYARKRTGDYGRWSQVTVSTWPEYSWELVGTMPRGDFRPAPRVDAGVLRLGRREESYGPPSALADYREMVAIGFRGVGGNLHASLSRVYPSGRVSKAFTQLGIPRDTIVAFVHPEEWWDLFLQIGPRPAPRPARAVDRSGSPRRPGQGPRSRRR